MRPYWQSFAGVSGWVSRRPLRLRVVPLSLVTVGTPAHPQYCQHSPVDRVMVPINREASWTSRRGLTMFKPVLRSFLFLLLCSIVLLESPALAQDPQKKPAAEGPLKPSRKLRRQLQLLYPKKSK